MNRNISIQLIAAFLLLVFVLNTAVGFACVIGVDMGFNTSHHHDEEAEMHVQADGKEHDHLNQSAKHEHEENKSQNKEKRGCCNDEVQKLQSLDKAINQNEKPIFNAPIVTGIISAFLGTDILNLSKVYHAKYKSRYFHPPPPDIRIAIQSFQI